jgi:hypothetical protein
MVSSCAELGRDDVVNANRKVQRRADPKVQRS